MRTNWKKIAHKIVNEIETDEGLSRCDFCKPFNNGMHCTEIKKCPTDEEIIEHYRQKIKEK